MGALGTRRLLPGAAVALVLATASCAGDGTAGPDGGTGAETPTFADDVQPIFTANCAFSGCHSGASAAQGMNLSTGQAYLNTVNVPSVELPSMDRIEPGQPDLSYLMQKIQGTQASVGGSGQRMPLGMTPLSQDQIDAIRAWIAAGAPDN